MSEFDREERDILTTYERDEWRPVAERGAENKMNGIEGTLAPPSGRIDG